MNWIDIRTKNSELFKFEIIEKFKDDIFVPQNQWISYQTYSCKLKCPKEINLIGLKGYNFFGTYKLDGIYYGIDFKLLNIRGISKLKDYSIIKLVCDDVEINKHSNEMQNELALIEKQNLRNNKLSELFEL
jgi:hypothetical protein